VGDEVFALPLEGVVEVVPVSTEGRAATRQGSEVVVVSGHSLLGSPGHPRSERLHGLVVRSGSKDAILAVDRVLGIRDVASRSIVAPPDRFSQRTVALVSGLVPGADGMIVLLDSAAIAAAGDRVGS